MAELVLEEVNMESRKNKRLVRFLFENLNVKYTSLLLDKITLGKGNMSISDISKLLSLYNIKSDAVFAESRYDFIDECDTIFIAQSYDRNICVKKVNQNLVKTYDGQSERIIEIDQFVKIWTGVALLVEKTSESHEPNYKQNLYKSWIEKLVRVGCVFIACFFFFLLCIKSINGNLGYIISLLINSIGVVVCMLLVTKQLGRHLSVTEKVCTAFTKQDGCQNVLNTPAAKIGGVISWSEIGLGFFFANIVCFVYMPSYFNYVLLFNCIALPFSIWSICYQKFVARQWCVLCLCSQVVLWSFCLFAICYFQFQTTGYRWGQIFVAALLYAFIILLINRAVYYVSKQHEITSLYIEKSTLYLDSTVFNFLLTRQTYYNVNRDVSSIVFGNVSAKNLVTIVTNPFCPHCAELHRDIQEFDFLHNSDYCIQYVFNSYSSNKQIIDKLLVSLYFNVDRDECITIYEKWFLEGYRDPGKFTKRFHVMDNWGFEVEEECQKQWNWMEENKIVKTPIVLVNGYKLPVGYSVRDLIFIDL